MHKAPPIAKEAFGKEIYLVYIAYSRNLQYYMYLHYEQTRIFFDVLYRTCDQRSNCHFTLAYSVTCNNHQW